MTKVFPPGATRVDTQGYRRTMPRFEYLDRSARTEAQRVRRLIERWVHGYPLDHQQEWIARFSSGDDIAFSSAFFELYLYTYFVCSGFRVEVAPGGENKTARAPDFKITVNDVGFYLEATTAHDETNTERRVKAWQNSVRARIDAIESGFFYVGLQWPRQPEEQPATARVKREVERWLSALDYPAIRTRFEINNDFALPELTVQTGGGELRIHAIPKRHPRAAAGIVTADADGLRQVQVTEAIRNSVRKKSRRYGALDLPYVVAVNVIAETAEEDDFLDALLGSGEVRAYPDGRVVPAVGSDGSFGTPSHPRATGVSAVICVRDISPWTPGQEDRRRRMYLIHNPQAERRLPLGALALTERWITDGKLNQSRGRLARNTLGIPTDWPEVIRKR